MGLSYKETRKKPIGVFDSGVGGLTVVKAMKSILPDEDIIYFGDTQRVPYGGKDKSTIIRYAHQDIAFLKSMNVKIIVAACGTVSSYLEGLEPETDVIGVIQSTCLAAVSASKNGKIGVMGTAAAVNSKSYERCIINLSPELSVYQQECPLLVPLIEKGYTADSSLELCRAVKSYVEPLIEKNVDTLILGCTHYPIIKNIIQKTVGERITLIDSGEETAKFTKKVLINQNLSLQSQVYGKQKFFVSGDIQNFSKTAKAFLGYDIYKDVKNIDINNY